MKLSEVWTLLSRSLLCRVLSRLHVATSAFPDRPVHRSTQASRGRVPCPHPALLICYLSPRGDSPWGQTLRQAGVLIRRRGEGTDTHRESHVRPRLPALDRGLRRDQPARPWLTTPALRTVRNTGLRHSSGSLSRLCHEGAEDNGREQTCSLCRGCCDLCFEERPQSCRAASSVSSWSLRSEASVTD